MKRRITLNSIRMCLSPQGVSAVSLETDGSIFARPTSCEKMCSSLPSSFLFFAVLSRSEMVSLDSKTTRQRWAVKLKLDERLLFRKASRVTASHKRADRKYSTWFVSLSLPVPEMTHVATHNDPTTLRADTTPNSRRERISEQKQHNSRSRNHFCRRSPKRTTRVHFL